MEPMELEQPLPVGTDPMEGLAPAITKKDMRDEKRDKASKLASVMSLGEDTKSPFGVLGAAMQGYAESGGSWSDLGSKVKGMFGG